MKKQKQQGRLFSYPDTHRHRLGSNYLQIPINCPFRVRKVSNYQRDGPQCVTDNSGWLNIFINQSNFPKCLAALCEAAIFPKSNIGYFIYIVN